jgi:hypothetical protein
MDNKPTDQLSDEDAVKRMDSALRRALNTPPTPHSESSPKKDKDASQEKRPKA